MTLTIRVVFLFIALAAVQLNGQTVKLVNYAGTLRDGSGQPFTGTVSVTFNIYRSPRAESPVWSETHQNISVQNGNYDVLLGSINPLRLSFYEYYLEVQPSAGKVSQEREVIVGSGYNFRMWFLFWAYTIIWVALFAYMVSISRRQKRVLADLQLLGGTAAGR